MGTISIYYICTGLYIKYLDDFVEHIKDFKKDNIKNLVIITDSAEDFVSKYSALPSIIVYQHYIQHFVWPIVTLFKMKHMLDFWHEADYAFYFNANLMVSHEFDIELKKCEIIFAKHWAEGLSYTFYNQNQIKNSSSYIDYNKIPKGLSYCQGAFFGGDAPMVKHFCQDVFDMLKSDLLKNIIPTWHDESYLNKWLYTKFIQNQTDNIKIIRLREVGELLEKAIKREEI